VNRALTVVVVGERVCIRESIVLRAQEVTLGGDHHGHVRSPP
jgi:hypothetical protein